MATRFDASTVKDTERYAYWHDVLFRFFCRAESERLNDRAFNASLAWSPFGCLEVSDIRCEALRYERSTGILRSAPNDDFLVSVLLEGEGRLSQQGRFAKQLPGDLVVYDGAQGFVYEFPQPYRMILLKIPRRALLSRVADAERLTSVVIRGDSALGSLAGSMIRHTAAVELPGDTSAAARVGASLIDVLAATMETELTGRERACDRHVALLNRAKDYIRAHLDDPDLDLDSVANAIYVSPRTLNRLFASEGTPVMRWLWKERLERSHRALTEGRAGQVTEVALTYGFKSMSHFSRTFKEAYGVAPHTVLRAPSEGHRAVGG